MAGDSWREFAENAAFAGAPGQWGGGKVRAGRKQGAGYYWSKAWYKATGPLARSRSEPEAQGGPELPGGAESGRSRLRSSPWAS